jgi:hypothetical protein
MPDAKKVFAKSNVKPKDEEVVYFERFGYAKFNGFDGKKMLFWFTHE